MLAETLSERKEAILSLKEMTSVHEVLLYLSKSSVIFPRIASSLLVVPVLTVNVDSVLLAKLKNL